MHVNFTVFVANVLQKIQFLSICEKILYFVNTDVEAYRSYVIEIT